MKNRNTKCCWWDLWSCILKGELERVYQEANGVKSRGLAARQTLWAHKCKTNRMKTSLKPSEHMKARKRWSWVRGAEETLGTPFDPSMRRTCLCLRLLLTLPDSLGSRNFRVLRLKAQRQRHRRSDRSFPPKTVQILQVFEEESLQSCGFTQIPQRAS